MVTEERGLSPLENWRKLLVGLGGWMIVITLAAGWARAVDAPPAPKDANGIDQSLLIEPGELPTYDFLRLTEGEEMPIMAEYLLSLATVDEDVLTSSIVFPEVDPSLPYARMTLNRLIEVTLESNFDLINSERNVRIARSQTRSAEAQFIPFVDLVANSRYARDIDRNAGVVDPATGMPRDTTRYTDSLSNEAGVETGVNLPSGGRITADGTMRRTDTWTEDWSGRTDSKRYSSNAEIRFLQPLLRGGGAEVGTADLREARISEMDRVISDQLRQRDVVLEVINTYFRILQSARQLEVSRGAIAIRLQTLYDARERYNVGRVDESEILRAEINYLRELQTAIDRRRSLDEQREDMLLLLALPLDTPISFFDITPELARRGRVEIPRSEDGINEMLNSRMELMQADLDIASSRIGLAVARNDLLPNLDFDAGYYRSDADDDYGRAIGMENEGWDAGLGLRIPLINIQRRESHRRTLISLEQRETARLQLERSLIQEVLSALRNVNSAEVQLVILRKNVEQSRKTLQLITGRFEVGFEQVTEVRLAQDDLFSAETSYSNTLLNYQIAIARLYVALGRPLI